jgi:hypothetical protein
MNCCRPLTLAITPDKGEANRGQRITQGMRAYAEQELRQVIDCAETP